MNGYLLSAAILVFAVAALHSVAGEMLLLRPMKNERLPVMFGMQFLSKRTIRLVWHLTTAFAVLIGIELAYLAGLHTLDQHAIFFIALTAISMFLCFLIAVLISRGQHPCWAAFLVIGVLCLMGIR
jgi:hypothetical protein